MKELNHTVFAQLLWTLCPKYNCHLKAAFQVQFIKLNALYLIFNIEKFRYPRHLKVLEFIKRVINRSEQPFYYN